MAAAILPIVASKLYDVPWVVSFLILYNGMYFVNVCWPCSISGRAADVRRAATTVRNGDVDNLHSNCIYSACTCAFHDHLLFMRDLIGFAPSSLCFV